MDKAELEKKIREIERRDSIERAKKLEAAAKIHNEKVRKAEEAKAEEEARARAEKAVREPSAFRRVFGVTTEGGISGTVSKAVDALDRLGDKVSEAHKPREKAATPEEAAQEPVCDEASAVDGQPANGKVGAGKKKNGKNGQ